MRKTLIAVLSGICIAAASFSLAACGDRQSSSAPGSDAGHTHEYVLKSETPATCTEYGVKEYVCSREGCGETKEEFSDPIGPKVRLGECVHEGCTLTVPTDFLVEVPADRDAVGLQLTDPQVIDSAQRRTPSVS